MCVYVCVCIIAGSKSVLCCVVEKDRTHFLGQFFSSLPQSVWQTWQQHYLPAIVEKSVLSLAEESQQKQKVTDCHDNKFCWIIYCLRNIAQNDIIVIDAAYATDMTVLPTTFQEQWNFNSQEYSTLKLEYKKK